MIIDHEKQRQLAVTISLTASQSQGDALRQWAYQLLEIHDGNLPARQKVKLAISVTKSAGVTWPLLKIIASQVKKHGWDNRTGPQKFGLSFVAGTVALFGNSGAGIAAFGTAVGVPLWIVLGGGAMFARYLYDELSEKGRQKDAGVSYRVIDAEKQE